MKLIDIATFRLSSQQISLTKFKTAKEIVGWMGAMQAQDYAMAKWAVGIRLPNATDKLIEKAIHKGDIIRTHLMRPTWHFVSSDDIYWMLELTAPRIKAAMKSSNNALELTEKVFKKCYMVMEKVLKDNNHLTRDSLISELNKAKINTDSFRSSHILMWCEIEGIICSGEVKNNKQTYTLLPERVRKKKTFSKEESLGMLAMKYFSSHCPATLKDFIWWSGLSVADARNALGIVKSKLVSETIGEETYWFANSYSKIKEEKNSVHLLPAFDEYLISYKDRTASIQMQNHKLAISNNGIFRPIIVIDGNVIGLWKRTVKNYQVIIGFDFFTKVNKLTRDLCEKEAMKFGKFLDKKVIISR